MTPLTIRCHACAGNFREDVPRAGRYVFLCHHCRADNAVTVAPKTLRGCPATGPAEPITDAELDEIRRAMRASTAYHDVHRLVSHVEYLRGLIADLCEDNHDSHEWVRAKERARLLDAAPALLKPFLRLFLARYAASSGPSPSPSSTGGANSR